MSVCGIYKIQNNINFKVYIGQSIDIKTRWKNHRYYARNQSNYPLYLAFQKYGIENFTFSIIEECSINALDDREKYWIQYYNSFEKGYNQTLGGQGSQNNTVKLSEEDVFIIYDLLQNSDILQKDIAKSFNVGDDTISEINHGKTRRHDGYNYPLRNNKTSKNCFCLDCGRKIYPGGFYCIKCSKIHARKVKRPSRDILKEKIKVESFSDIGKFYGVSDNAVKKWCDYYSLPRRKKDINQYSDEEWNKI